MPEPTRTPGPTVGAPTPAAAPAPAPAHPAPAAATHAGAAHPTPNAPEKKKDELDFVRVKNNGKVKWVGSDFKTGGSGVIEPGQEGRVTLKKARDLVDDYAPFEKDNSVAGPFEILDGD